MFTSPQWLSFRNVLLLSIVIRLGLIVYSEWHDAHSVVKYTDVDYRVFSDASGFLVSPGPGDTNRGQGPFGRVFNVGDPYTRETYRYTPLLALLVIPNGWLHPSFGKYLFALCDVLNGIIVHQLLKTEILPRTSPTAPKTSSPTMENERLATLLSAAHLLNPLVFSISTRGSSEAVLSLFVLSTLYAALKENWDLCAVFLGLSTHWKIYPLIYGVSCLGAMSGRGIGCAGFKGFLRSIVNLKTMRFVLFSAGTFFLLGVGCYALWGYPFLYESYLYHLHRLDHRHNFSPYFYLTYLTYPLLDPIAASTEPHTLWIRVLRSPLMSFGPQMGLALGLGLLFGRAKEHLVFTWFVQTTVFVVFNKVCTSQYFLWYLLLLPLLIPQLSMTKARAALFAVVWAGTQALWLSGAYKLEFLGQNVFLALWIRGLIYVIGNCWIIAGLMDSYETKQIDSNGINERDTTT